MEVRERGVRTVFKSRAKPSSQWSAIESTAELIGYLPLTLHALVRWVEIDGGQRDGVSIAEVQRIKELKRDVRELRKASQWGKLVLLPSRIDCRRRS